MGLPKYFLAANLSWASEKGYIPGHRLQQKDGQRQQLSKASSLGWPTLVPLSWAKRGKLYCHPNFPFHGRNLLPFPTCDLEPVWRSQMLTKGHSHPGLHQSPNSALGKRLRCQKHTYGPSDFISFYVLSGLSVALLPTPSLHSGILFQVLGRELIQEWSKDINNWCIERRTRENRDKKCAYTGQHMPALALVHFPAGSHGEWMMPWISWCWHLTQPSAGSGGREGAQEQWSSSEDQTLVCHASAKRLTVPWAWVTFLICHLEILNHSSSGTSKDEMRSRKYLACKC